MHLKPLPAVLPEQCQIGDRLELRQGGGRRQRAVERVRAEVVLRNRCKPESVVKGESNGRNSIPLCLGLKGGPGCEGGGTPTADVSLSSCISPFTRPPTRMRTTDSIMQSVETVFGRDKPLLQKQSEAA